MTESPEMEDRFMSEILTDFFKRVHEFDELEDFSLVITGDTDGVYRVAVIAGGESTMGRGSGTSWFDATQKAVSRSLVRLDTIRERIEAEARLDD